MYNPKKPFGPLPEEQTVRNDLFELLKNRMREVKKQNPTFSYKRRELNNPVPDRESHLMDMYNWLLESPETRAIWRNTSRSGTSSLVQRLMNRRSAHGIDSIYENIGSLSKKAPQAPYRLPGAREYII